MKKQLLKSALIAVAGVGLLASVSIADTFYNRIDTAVTFDSTHTTYTWTWNLDTANNLVGWTGNVNSPTPNNIVKNINSEDTITFANLYINFTDRDADEDWEFDWNTFTWVDNGEQETGTGYYDGIYSWTKEIDSGNTIATVTSYLQADHTFSLKIERVNGDFGVNFAKLYGNYTDNAPVPEPATMLLFGTGLAGLAAAARRRKTNQG